MPTWRNAVETGVIRVVRGSDAGHVGAVRPGVHHDRQHRPAVVDVHREVARVLSGEGPVLALYLRMWFACVRLCTVVQ